MSIVAEYAALRVRNENLISLFLNQNICCGYSKEPSQWDGSFQHPKHMLKLMGKKIFTILRQNFFIYLNLCVTEFQTVFHSSCVFIFEIFI